MQKPLDIRFEENTLVFHAEEYTPHFAPKADFFRLHLDHCKNGGNHELGVYSHRQTPASVQKKDGGLLLYYEDLLAEDGNRYPIALTLTVRQGADGALEYTAAIDNRSTVRINELQYPLLELAYSPEESRRDLIHLPYGLGKRIEDPLSYIEKGHTEYLAADYKNVWRHFIYPGDLSMPWVCFQHEGHTLALSRRDETWRLTGLTLGTGPREEQGCRLILAVSSYVGVLPKECSHLETYRLALYTGDWREEADSYRAWLNRTCLKDHIDEGGRVPHKKSIRSLHGWQRIILKHQYGEILHTYHDLPRIYRDGARYGIRMILLFGWWQEGMDAGYPNYQPDEALGGAEGLRRAIREINALGGRVVLYANGHLIDVNTDYYRNEGHQYTMKDIELQEYREHYSFANNGTMLRFGGLKTFVGGCFGTPGWRARIHEIADRQLALGSNGVFFDQLSTCFRLCFDQSHEHKSRIDTDPDSRVESVMRIRARLKEEEWFGSEWASDRISPLLDFTHGCGYSCGFDEEAYPYIYRYTFPEVLLSNRFAHDEKPGFARELNYAFLHGLLFDVALWRCRIDTMSDLPAYAAQIKRLTDLRERYLDFFVDGQYDLPEISLPQGIKGVTYRLRDRRILVLWNDSNEAFSYLGTTVPPGDVAVVSE